MVKELILQENIIILNVYGLNNGASMHERKTEKLMTPLLKMETHQHLLSKRKRSSR